MISGKICLKWFIIWKGRIEKLTNLKFLNVV